MSERAQRVLDALIEYDNDYSDGYPITVIYHFFDKYNNDEDYENLTAEEERQVIEKFLEFAY